jgi:hypothetical protein
MVGKLLIEASTFIWLFDVEAEVITLNPLFVAKVPALQFEALSTVPVLLTSRLARLLSALVVPGQHRQAIPDINRRNFKCAPVDGSTLLKSTPPQRAAHRRKAGPDTKTAQP